MTACAGSSFPFRPSPTSGHRPGNSADRSEPHRPASRDGAGKPCDLGTDRLVDLVEKIDVGGLLATRNLDLGSATP
jgi:hypothetical protein